MSFVLVAEGSSDGPLLAHLEALCIRAGASEVIGYLPDFSRLQASLRKDVGSKVAAALRLEPDVDVVFVHRDADRIGRQVRAEEIARAVKEVGCLKPVAPVIPVQELEAWLLLDEAAIRAVAGNPRGVAPLNLPTHARVEDTPRPKEVLARALVDASEASGRRLRRIRKDLAFQRADLLRQLDLDGPICSLSAWRALVSVVNSAVAELIVQRRSA